MSLETKDLLNTKLGHMGPKHKPFLVLDISWEGKIHFERGRILVTLKMSDPFSSIFNWNFFFLLFLVGSLIFLASMHPVLGKAKDLSSAPTPVC